MINEDLTIAIEILKNGGIVIFPTDTAFGIGCRMDDKATVERLFKVRKRPVTQATPVLVDSVDMAMKYSKKLDTRIIKLMKDFWPGALTIIIPAKENLVPSLVRGETKTIGLRIPNHQTPLSLIKALNVPILGPSANFHTEPTPFYYEDLNPKLIKLVDYVIKGNCPVKKASTVIDVCSDNWQIVRQGAIKIDLNIYNKKSKITLFIDTSKTEESKVGLFIDNSKIFLSDNSKKLKAQSTLILIDKILKQNKLTLKDLTKIEVNKGPGSFTGLRVGIAIANALGFLLKIPINNRNLDCFEIPQY